MRVLQIVNIGFEAGGAEKSVRIIADGLRQRGDQVLVLATDRQLADAGGEVGVFADELIPAIRGGALSRVARYAWYPTAHRSTRRLLAEFRPDLVHLHTVGEFSPSVLAATAGLPRVLTVHGPEDWTSDLLRWNLRSAPQGRLSATDTARLVYLRGLQRPLYRARLRSVSRFVTPSRYLADAIAGDVDPARIRVLNNGVDLPDPSPVRSSDQILYAGRLESVKGVEELVRAMPAVLRARPEARLTLAGDGGRRADLERAAAELGIADRVEFLGHLAPPQVAEQLRRCTLLALPSVWPENFPTIVLEALGTGRPVVASRVGGLPELVTDQHNGRLVPPGDVDALAAALIQVLSDPTLTVAMGAASAAAAGPFRAEPFLTRIQATYQEVLDDRIHHTPLPHAGRQRVRS